MVGASPRQLRAVRQGRVRHRLRVHVLATEDAALALLAVARKDDALVRARVLACKGVALGCFHPGA
jgi:hypothetical protein